MLCVCEPSRTHLVRAFPVKFRVCRAPRKFPVFVFLQIAVIETTTLRGFRPQLARSTRYRVVQVRIKGGGKWGDFYDMAPRVNHEVFLRNNTYTSRCMYKYALARFNFRRWGRGVKTFYFKHEKGWNENSLTDKHKKIGLTLIN